MVSSRLRSSANPYIELFARPIAKIGLNPSIITLTGLLLSLLAGIMYAEKNLFLAALALLLSSFLDVIDGAVARLSNKVSAFGGFLDSLSDRYSDSMVLIGIALFLGGHYILIIIVLVGSLLVSYTRARAEMEIEKCDVGFGERAERLMILISATILQAVSIVDVNFLYWALVFLAFITHLTVVQRVLFTYTALEKS